jgi:hypothetical protein
MGFAAAGDDSAGPPAEARPMTQTAATPATHSTPRSDRTLRTTSALAALSGGALIVDTVTTAVLNRHFDPLDSILFLVGFVGVWATAIALAVHLSAGRHGARRAGVGVGLFVAIAAVLGAVSVAFDQLGRHVFSPSNIGLHGEWSFFSIGVCLVIIAVWARTRLSRR